MSNPTKAFPWTLSDGVLSIKVDRATITLDETHPNFARALSALRSKEWDLVPALINISSEITKLGAGLITVKGDEVFYQGNPIANSLTDRIVKMMGEGVKNLQPMVNFLENCMLNPNKDAQARLFTFLEKSKLPLTPDGCFLAYRGVREDFKDKHSGTFDNSPGQIVKMDRKGCDEDSHSCCSRGLHFCSLPYLGPTGGWAGGRDNLIVIKINPRDVVAIPYTYDDTKGRCCRFEVLRTWQDADSIKDLSKDAWETSLVAETEEVANPSVRAMLNLARIEESMEGFDLKPVLLPTEEDQDSGEAEADYCGECGEFTDECVCDYIEETDEEDELSDLLSALPGSTFRGDRIELNGGSMPKGDLRREVIAQLHSIAMSQNAPAYCFKKDRNHKLQNDIKVSPKGSVLVFDAESQRWAAWYSIKADQE